MDKSTVFINTRNKQPESELTNDSIYNCKKKHEIHGKLTKICAIYGCWKVQTTDERNQRRSKWMDRNSMSIDRKIWLKGQFSPQEIQCSSNPHQDFFVETKKLTKKLM